MSKASPSARRRTRLATATSILLSATTSSTWAADPPPDVVLPLVSVTATKEGDKDYNPTVTNTVTKTDTPLRDIPASVTIVPRQLIEDASMLSIGDVLRYVPGVMMHQGENNRDDIVIRGNRTNADFFVNGIRDDAQIFRDLYNVQQVDVLKGPASVIFGRGGAGGIVNRVTKRPLFAPVGEATVLVGNYDQLRGTFDIGNQFNESVAWRINGVAEHSDSFRDGVTLDRWGINPTMTFRFAPQTALLVDYEHLDDRRNQDRGIPSQNGAPYNTSRSQFFGNAEQSVSNNGYDALYLLLDHAFDNGWSLRNAFRVVHYDRFYQNVYPGSAVNAAGLMTISAYNNANQRTNYFNQTDLVKTFFTGSVAHTLLVGAELGYQDSANQRLDGVFGANTYLNLPNVPATNPYTTVSRFAPNPNGSNANNNVTAEIGAAYVQDQITFTEQWKAVLGIRYDRFKVNYDDLRTLVPPTDLSRTDNAWSPRAALLWEPNNWSSYYLAYSYAFLPSGEQLSLAPTTADLAPESAKNYEIGARWNITPRLMVQAAIFRLDRDDVRAADPNNPGFFVKTGQQRTEGAEVGIQGAVTDYWAVFGGYTYLDSRVTKPFNSGTAATISTIIPAGTRVGLTPQNMFSLWNRFDFTQGWGAGLGVIYTDDYYTSFTNLVKIPAYTRVDGAIYYTFADGKARVALNVENIFNEKYYPTVDGDNNISPGAPTNARLTFTYAF